jgi:hypothetical protein
MAKKSKNPAQFTENEMKLINGIILSLAIKLHDYIENYNDPEEYSKDLSQISESDKGLALSTLFFNINNMDSDQPFFPEEINEKLAKNFSKRIPALPELIRSLKSTQVIKKCRPISQ